MALNYESYLGNPANFAEPDAMVTFENQGSLAAGLFRPEGAAKSVLIFYHGGGGRMGGYGGLARAVCQTAQAAVLTPDLRGHGRSSGPRGYAATPELVWRDVDAAIAWAAGAFPGVPVFVGGHSSGGGMVINWAAHRTGGAKPVAGLVLLTPMAGTERQKPAFAIPRAWVFAAYLLSGKRLMAKADAVRFTYPEGHAESRGLVRAYSAGMSMAVTPRDAPSLLRRIGIPVLIIAAEEDELFDTERLRGISPSVSFTSVPGTHLSCFLAAAPPVAGFLAERQAA